jgi:hypothetical protein
MFISKINQHRKDKDGSPKFEVGYTSPMFNF